MLHCLVELYDDVRFVKGLLANDSVSFLRKVTYPYATTKMRRAAL